MYKILRLLLVCAAISFQNVCFGASFSTLNHPKANGLNIQLKYPDKWTKQESNLPHIVQVFTFDSKESCSLLIRDTGEKFTNEEWKDLFLYDADTVIQDIVRDGNMFYNPKYTQTKYSAFLHGLVIHVDDKFEQAGLVLYGQTDIYTFGYENNTIILQCSAMDTDKEKANKIYEEHKMDFWKIGISMSLLDVYK